MRGYLELWISFGAGWYHRFLFYYQRPYGFLQDPLDIIPVLLPVKTPAAKDIIIQIGERCSAKEVVIAVQEAVERLQNTFTAESDDSEEEDRVLSPAAQLNTLISLYSLCMLFFFFCYVIRTDFTSP